MPLLHNHRGRTFRRLCWEFRRVSAAGRATPRSRVPPPRPDRAALAEHSARNDFRVAARRGKVSSAARGAREKVTTRPFDVQDA